MIKTPRWIVRVFHLWRQLRQRYIHFFSPLLPSSRDALTALPNRSALSQYVHTLIYQPKKTPLNFALLYIDIDRFKLINDSFGYSIGDQLLVKFSNRIKSHVKKGDFLCRFGNDEFVMVAYQYSSIDELTEYANQLLLELKNPFQFQNQEVIISPSIGISLYPDDGNGVETLVSCADLAMHHACELGGNHIYFYSKSLTRRSTERLSLEVDFHHALKNEEFFLCYQPQVDLHQQRIVSAEALIRWRHPTKGILSPGEFVPLTEDLGAFNQLNEWIVRTVCRQNKSWQAAGLPKMCLSVNITPQQFNQLGVVESIQTILKETGLDPNDLELELKENILINGVDAIEKVSRLKALGIRIAMDDFGTGYSSLSYLRKIPLSALKIDKSFIDHIGEHASDEVIIQAIITVAKQLGLEVIAEGVETEEQLYFLKDNGCDKIQGFYVSEPLEAEFFMQRLVASHA